MVAALFRSAVIQFGILAQLVEHLTFNQVVGGSNPPCLSRNTVFMRVCEPAKSKVTKKVTKVTKKIDSRKGKELEFCTRGMVLAFFYVTLL